MITHPSPLLAPACLRPEPIPAHLPAGRRICTRRMCLPEHVALAAELAPESVALSWGAARMTYGGLNARSNQLAAYLRAFGVTREVAVALNLERSFDFVVAALAVWKAGGAYLPLDPAWPLARREEIVDQACAPVLITRLDCAIKSRYLVDLEFDSAAIAREQPVLTPLVTRRENLACILYDENAPAGVELTHGNLLNLVFWHRRAFGLTAADRGAQLARVSSGTAVWEMWPHLACGGSVGLADDAPLAQWMAREGVTVAHLSVEQMHGLDASNLPLRYVFTDAVVEPADVPFKIVSVFGAPECTMVSMTEQPITNTEIYLLNRHGDTVEAGTMGDLYIGGAGVARGYRARPDLTRQHFLRDPFRPAGARMYRTGAKASLLSNGRLVLREAGQASGENLAPAN